MPEEFVLLEFQGLNFLPNSWVDMEIIFQRIRKNQFIRVTIEITGHFRTVGLFPISQMSIEFELKFVHTIPQIWYNPNLPFSPSE